MKSQDRGWICGLPSSVPKGKLFTNSGNCFANPDKLKDFGSAAAAQIPGVKLFTSGISGFFRGGGTTMD